MKYEAPLTLDASGAAAADEPPRPRGRRRYRRPAILERETLEAMAAECSAPGGKSDPTCSFGFS